jgi:hypothetical protein
LVLGFKAKSDDFLRFFHVTWEANESPSLAVSKARFCSSVPGKSKPAGIYALFHAPWQLMSRGNARRRDQPEG